MPAKVVKRGGKYRVVDPNGRLVRRIPGGKPSDGGGHRSRSKAARQASAINMNLRKKGKI